MILQKVFVREFYRANASLFLIVLGAGVGFMKGEDHAILAQIIVDSPFLVVIPFTVWFIYSIIIVDFNYRTTSRPEHEFVYHFMLFSKKQQWVLALGIAVAQFLPALAYGLFLVAAGVKFNMWVSVALLLASLATVLVSIVLLLLFSLTHPGADHKVSRLSRRLSQVFTRPHATFAPEAIIRKQPVSSLGCKIFGLALLWASLALYATDSYDVRLLGIGLALGISANAGTVSGWHYFDNVSLMIFRGLPVTLPRRSIQLLASLGLFMLPEIGLLISGFPASLPWHDLAGAIVFLVSIPYIAYSVLFVKYCRPDRYMNIHFFTTLAWVILISAGTSLWLLAAVNFVVGYFCWKTSYYSYEYSVPNDDIVRR